MSRHRGGVQVGPVTYALLVLFAVVMVVGALYYAALIGLIVGAVWAVVQLYRWASRPPKQ